MLSNNTLINRVVKVVRRAQGIPTPDVFEVVDAPMPTLPSGGVVVRVLFTAADPGMRGWLTAETNYQTVPNGAVMRALGVGEIIESDAPGWAVGERAFGWFGWQRFAAVAVGDLMWKIDTEVAPASAWVGALGVNGLAAWIGFSHIARPRAGETALITTAAGGVGGVVGQLAAAAGVRAIGVTGSDVKVKAATEELGYAAAINYKAVDDLSVAIGAVCPDGIDIFFDNTAGWIADAVFPHLKVGARVVQCGTASVASWLPVPQGPRRERDVLVKRLSWHGFVMFDHREKFDQALTELKALLSAGKLSIREEVLEGIDQAPDAIGRLYRGDNIGRLLIKP